jgi:hypothetical protein
VRSYPPAITACTTPDVTVTTDEALEDLVDNEDAVTVTEYICCDCKEYGGNVSCNGFGELLPV